jgi:septum site-determining protein MinC
MTLTRNAAAAESSPSISFRLKGGLFPLTLLEISRYGRAEFENDLQNKVEEAPAFFQQAPVILGFEGFQQDVETVPLGELQQLCRNYGLIPVALRSANARLQARARESGLALIPTGRGKTAPEPVQPVQPEAPERQEAGSARPHTPNRLVTTPIRSGQQVYAAGGDLVVVAPVSAGAEILADGNIHIYGALRGRALAGVLGDSTARIFCHSLEAELISIAGCFKLDEDLRGEHWKKSVQVCLDEQSLDISPIA